jgi:transposase-like protein
LEENLVSSTGEEIKNLFGVRNRLIHFLGNTSGEGIKEETISHQLVSWHNLYNLYLNKSWKEMFKGYNEEISALDHKLRKHKKYLKIRFDHMIPNIEKLKKIGKQFTACPVCGFPALSEEQISSCLKNFKCHVCSYETRHYDIPTCPACSDYIVMDSNEDVCFCKGCKKNFQADEVVEAFKEVNPLTKDNYFEGHPIAHCIECFGLDCVLQIDEGNLWVCVYCKGEYAMQEVSHCEWCNDLNAGNLKDSFLIGCNACTGNHDFK